MGSDCVSIWEANKEGMVCRCKKLAPLAKSLSDQSAHEKPAEKSRQESTTEVLVPWSEAEAGTRPPAVFLQPFLLSALSDRPLNDGKPNLDYDPLRRSRLCMLMGVRETRNCICCSSCYEVAAFPIRNRFQQGDFR